MEVIIYLQQRSTRNQHQAGPMLQLSRLPDLGFQQQLWIILSLFLVKTFQHCLSHTSVLAVNDHPTKSFLVAIG